MAIWLISSRRMSFPEVMFISIFPAPFIERSRSGVFSACSTAFFALSSPSAFPKPNTVLPEFCNIDLMSAKSKFTIPCFFIKSSIPFTIVTKAFSPFS